MEFLLWVRDRFERVAPPLGRVLPWVGVLLLMMGAGFGVCSLLFARKHVRAIATITENVPGFAKEGGVVYIPRFRFRASSGELVTVMAHSGSEDIEFAAGDTVPVLYRAGDPQSAVIATAWRAYHAAIVLALWGVALFDLGWVLRGIVRRRVSG